MALTEGTHAGEFLISEAPGTLSRERVTIKSGQNLTAGTVLWKITADGKYKAVDNAASDGSQTATGILYEAVDASAADKDGTMIARLAEVTAAEIVWPSSEDPSDQAADTLDLAALFIVLR